jgi:hypothetical protein
MGAAMISDPNELWFWVSLVLLGLAAIFWVTLRR